MGGNYFNNGSTDETGSVGNIRTNYPNLRIVVGSSDQPGAAHALGMLAWLLLWRGH